MQYLAKYWGGGGGEMLWTHKTYIRPNLEFCIPAWCLYLSKYIEVMEKVQRRATKIVPRLKNLQYEDRLQRLGILNPSARRLSG